MTFKECLIYILLRIFLPGHTNTLEWKMLRLLNRDRRKHRLKALFMQDDLRKTARKHSRDMAKLDYFEHENKYGQSHADRYKIDRITDTVSGENLAKIGGYTFPTERAENGLMNSPGHRANILNDSYNCVGIGIHKSDKGVYYFTQNFAKRSLIFSNRIPKSITVGSNLNIYCYPTENIKSGIYRLIFGNEIIIEKQFILHTGKNLIKIPFKKLGLMKVEIYTNSSKKISFELVNTFEILVKTSWL